MSKIEVFIKTKMCSLRNDVGGGRMPCWRIEDGCLKNRTLPGRLTLNGSVSLGILIIEDTI